MEDKKKKNTLSKEIRLVWLIWAVMFYMLIALLVFPPMMADNLRTYLKAHPYSYRPINIYDLLNTIVLVCENIFGEGFSVTYLKNIFYGVAAAQFVFIHFIRKYMLPGKSYNGSVPMSRYLMTVFITSVFSAGIALYGIVFYMLGCEVSSLYSYTALSVIAMIVYRPRWKDTQGIV